MRDSACYCFNDLVAHLDQFTMFGVAKYVYIYPTVPQLAPQTLQRVVDYDLQLTSADFRKLRPGDLGKPSRKFNFHFSITQCTTLPCRNFKEPVIKTNFFKDLCDF